jgi:hypothetical protein
MSGTGPSSGFWGGACWGLFISGLLAACLGESVAGAICVGCAVVAAAIRETA